MGLAGRLRPARQFFYFQYEATSAMVRREQFVNNAQTALDGGINASVTTITVTDGTVFPSDGDFRARIAESEVVLVTGRSGNDLTVVRGQDGTTAASHSTGASVDVPITANALKTYIDDAAGGVTGRQPSRLLDVSGNVVNAASFTGVNMGTASVADDSSGGITMTDPQTTGGNRLQVKTAPSTPYKITAKFVAGIGVRWGTAGTIFGLLFRESSTQEFMLNYYEPNDMTHVGQYDNATTFNSFLVGELNTDGDSTWIWQQIEDDGTDLFFRISHDGINFLEVGSPSRTAFMATGPDQVGWSLNSRGEANKLLHLKSWIEE